MKILIWSQFSSNHSADFTLVGEFATAEQAAEAAEKIRYILREIATYWQSLSEDQRRELRQDTTDTPTPVEDRLSQAYGVEWPARLDWLPTDPTEAIEAMALFQNVVIIENTGPTWVGPQPFKRLLEKWGAEVVGREEATGDYCLASITCLAPDEATAERLITDYEIEWADDDPDFRERDLLIAGHIRVTDEHTIAREGRKLIYPQVDFDDWKSDFPALITYLSENGCTEIVYKFSR